MFCRAEVMGVFAEKFTRMNHDTLDPHPYDTSSRSAARSRHQNPSSTGSSRRHAIDTLA